MPLPNMDPARSAEIQYSFKFVCETFGIEYNQETADHMLVMVEALKIYNERSKKYGQLWKDAGAAQNFYDAYRKARRLKALYGNRVEAVPDGQDDALDVINYVIFGIRNSRDGVIEEQGEDEGQRFAYGVMSDAAWNAATPSVDSQDPETGDERRKRLGL